MIFFLYNLGKFLLQKMLVGTRHDLTFAPIAPERFAFKNREEWRNCSAKKMRTIWISFVRREWGFDKPSSEETFTYVAI